MTTVNVTEFDPQLLHYIITNRKSDLHGSKSLNILKTIPDPGYLVDSKGRTLLHYAAENFAFLVVQYLIAVGTDIDAQDCDGKTALMLAADHNAIISLLLIFNPNIHLCDNEGKCVAQLFPESIRHRIVDKLNEEYSGDTEKVAAKLIEWKCSVYSSLELRKPQLTRLLLAHGCPLESPDENLANGMTALIRAVQNNDLENTKIILDCGVDVNAVNNKATTALIEYGNLKRGQNPEILRLLIERGVEPTQIVTHTYEPGQFKGQMQMCTIFKFCRTKLVRMLLRRQLDLNAKDANGCTAIHYLAQNSAVNLKRLLLGQHFDVNARDFRRRTPLHYVQQFNLAVPIFLLDEGADVNAKDQLGLTPLMTAWSKYGPNQPGIQLSVPIKWEKAKQLFECLLNRGADPQASTTNNEYPIFSLIRAHPAFYWLQPVLAHLALVEARGVTIDPVIRQRITKNKLLEKYFLMCTKKMEAMKLVNVWKSVTLFQLMTVDQLKIESYVRNAHLIQNLTRLESKQRFPPYYVYVLRDRISKAVKLGGLRKKAAAILCETVGLCQTAHSIILDTITKHLDQRDLRHLTRE